jgi:hypothetical protein
MAGRSEWANILLTIWSVVVTMDLLMFVEFLARARWDSALVAAFATACMVGAIVANLLSRNPGSGG